MTAPSVSDVSHPHVYIACAIILFAILAIGFVANICLDRKDK